MCVSEVSLWVIIGSGIGMLPFQQQAKSYLNQCWFIVNTLRPRQDGRHFPDNIFKYIFLIENAWILIKIWLEFVPKSLSDNIPALVQIMAWRRPGGKPLWIHLNQ